MAKKVTKRMLEAARLIADGQSQITVAAHLGVEPESISRWFRDEDVMSEYRRCVRDASVSAVAKAQKVLIKQLDSEAGSGFLAQNAANSILNRSYAAVMGEEKQDITIHITGGMPALGMPKRTEEE